ncbi:recombinase family protein [Thalassoglobus sp.]|uniref:recombinase family protein n=1 Tax=Thalassoglobus sp. TaxID=2795869 RepID=UPI003AA91DB6
MSPAAPPRNLSRKKSSTPTIRCAIYTRKSTEEGLEQEFNTLDAQRESAEAYIVSMKHEGWTCVSRHYDDGGYTGGNIERPALKQLLQDIENGEIDCVIVYKVDRLSRSLTDFSRLMDTFDKHNVSFVSVTQQFNTTSSMGRLTLNILLSFAQFERELISERTRDKMGAARRKGKWCGGSPVFGYDLIDRKLVVNEVEARQVREIFELYLELKSTHQVLNEIEQRGYRTKVWTTRKGKLKGGTPFTKNTLLYLLRNVAYIGKVSYDNEIYAGEHEAVVSEKIFHETQLRLQHNAQLGGKREKTKSSSLLAGLVRCRACEAAMVQSTTKRGNRRYRYYVCSHAQKRGYDKCPAPTVSASELEKFVIDQIREVGRNPELREEVLRELQRQVEIRNAEQSNRQSNLEEELKALCQQLRDAAIDQRSPQRLADLNELIMKKQTEIERLKKRTSPFSEIETTDVEKLLSEFDDVWDEMTKGEQQQTLQLLVERIDYDGAQGEVTVTFSECGAALLEDAE